MIYRNVDQLLLCYTCFDLEQDAGDPSLLPRSYDVRVWVTRPHLALVEFPMSQKSSALILEGEGVYYRWQCVGLPEVRYSLLSVAVIFRYSNYQRVGYPLMSACFPTTLHSCWVRGKKLCLPFKLAFGRRELERESRQGHSDSKLISPVIRSELAFSSALFVHMPRITPAIDSQDM